MNLFNSICMVVGAITIGILLIFIITILIYSIWQSLVNYCIDKTNNRVILLRNKYYDLRLLLKDLLNKDEKSIKIIIEDYFKEGK